MFIKICGTTSEEDALLAVAMGADAIGFIFAPSKRQVQPAFVREIVSRIPAEVMTVGVFRDELPKRVIDIVQHTGLKAAQLHGHERPQDVAEVHKQVRYVIKVFPSDSPDLKNAHNYYADVVMLDNTFPGSGEVFDWKNANAVDPSANLLLAGGLNSENVAAAIRTVQPWGVDAVSGTEASPGKKDPRKLRAFIAAAREAAKEFETPADIDVENPPFDWRDG